MIGGWFVIKIIIGIVIFTVYKLLRNNNIKDIGAVNGGIKNE